MMEGYTNRGGLGRPEAKVHVERLVLLPTGQYHDQFNRAFRTKMSNGLIERVNQKFHESRDFGPSAFTGLSRDFIEYGSVEDTPVEIEHGWGQERARFAMEVVSTNIMGLQVREYITGYTDLPDGYDAHGVVAVGNTQGLVDVDPNLKFYINGIIDMHDQTIRGPRGLRTVRTMRSNVQLLSDPSYDGYSDHMEAGLKPTDIFFAMDGGLLSGSFGSNELHDTRILNTGDAKLSNRSNVIPSRYMSKIFDGYSKTLYADQTSHSDVGQGGSLYNQAAHLIKEDNNHECSFLKNLSRVMHTVRQPKQFTFRDLLKLDPSIERRVEGRIGSRGEKIRTHSLHDDETQGWYADDYETIAALTIAQTVSAVMSSMSIMFIDFSTSNHNVRNAFGMGDDKPMFSIAGMNLINRDDQQDSRKIVDAVEWRVWHEILRDITDMGSISYELRVQCDLAGETVIHLGMDGERQRAWVFPTFADSLSTPLVTHDLGLPSAIASDFKSLLDVAVDRPSFAPDYERLDIESERGYQRDRSDAYGESRIISPTPYRSRESRDPLPSATHPDESSDRQDDNIGYTQDKDQFFF